jgi:two-component system response regulator
MEYSETLQTFLTDFGSFVREERKKLGLSQEELADRSGLHRTYITDVERGVRNMTFESALKLTRALDLAIDQMFAEFRRGNNGHTSARLRTDVGSGPADLLLVEDDPRDAELTVAGLQRHALVNRITTAGSGHEALKVLRIDGENSTESSALLPHVVLLDLRLPDLDGIEVLRRIRAHARTTSVPVVILTASRSDVDQRECLRLGVSGYLTKPVDWVEFSLMMPTFGFRWMLLEKV